MGYPIAGTEQVLSPSSRPLAIQTRHPLVCHLSLKTLSGVTLNKLPVCPVTRCEPSNYASIMDLTSVPLIKRGEKGLSPSESHLPPRPWQESDHRSAHRKTAKHWERADTNIQDFSSHKDRKPALNHSPTPKRHCVTSDVGLILAALDSVRWEQVRQTWVLIRGAR